MKIRVNFGTLKISGLDKKYLNFVKRKTLRLLSAGYLEALRVEGDGLAGQGAAAGQRDGGGGGVVGQAGATPTRQEVAQLPQRAGGPALGPAVPPPVRHDEPLPPATQYNNMYNTIIQ